MLEEIAHVAVRGAHAGYDERGAIAFPVPVLVSVAAAVGGVGVVRVRINGEYESIIIIKDRITGVGEG